MTVLDFSTFSFDIDTFAPATDFEENVKDFLMDWFSSSPNIEVKTSGSTGVPKKILLTKKNMRKSAQLTGKYLNLKKGNIALLAMPVNYIAGNLMLVRAIEIGLKIILVTPTSTLNWKLFKNNFSAIDFVALTPMQVEKSLEFVENCKKVIIGGAPLNDKVKKDLYPFSNLIYETYAMTETITHIAFKKIPNSKYPNTSPYFEAFKEVKISKDSRNCLVIKTPYDEQEIITNDIVEIIDANKFLWIGRADNVINSGGIKIYPEQIEEKLKHFITEPFFITSKKDLLLGEKLILVIEGEYKKIDLDKLDLEKYFKPKEVIFVSKFPRTESGKIKRNEINLS